MENNYVMTCEKVTVIPLCSFCDSHLSMYQVSMSHFNGLGALKAVLIIGTDYRKIDNTLNKY